jgi:dTDP-4-dehydrorhamnose 3,5-epimerase
MNIPEKTIVRPFQEGEIKGVEVTRLKQRRDVRGWLVEIFRADELPSQIIPVMSYVSETIVGATRGPHEHANQTDYFCFLGPSTFCLVLWDNRRTSPTYWFRQELSVGEENPCVVIVPQGVVHAYRNVGHEPGWVFNCPNQLYAGNGRQERVDEIRHELDPKTPFQID